MPRAAPDLSHLPDTPANREARELIMGSVTFSPDTSPAQRDNLKRALAERAEAGDHPVDVEREADLQKRVDDWLHLRGYWHRTSADILCKQLPPAGWQIHIHRAKRNPFLLDKLLLRNDGRWCEFELKMPGGAWSGPEQRALCEAHGLPRFEWFDDVAVFVIEWEEAILDGDEVEEWQT